MAIFIDAFYPDNKNRSKRLSELSTDCATLFSDAAVLKESIDQKLASCHELIKKEYEGFGKQPPELKEYSIEAGWEVYVPELLMDLALTECAICGLRWAAAHYLLKQGKITEEVLKTVGAKGVVKVYIPRWMRIGGGAMAAIVVTVAVDMIVDAIDGAVERSKMQSALKEVSATRLQCKTVDMINRNLDTVLQAVIISCQTIEELKLPLETFEQALKNIIDKNRITESSIAKANAIAYLKDLDTQRKSWTNEDGDWEDSVGGQVNGQLELHALQPLHGFDTQSLCCQIALDAIRPIHNMSPEQKQLFENRILAKCPGGALV